MATASRPMTAAQASNDRKKNLPVLTYKSMYVKGVDLFSYWLDDQDEIEVTLDSHYKLYMSFRYSADSNFRGTPPSGKNLTLDKVVNTIIFFRVPNDRTYKYCFDCGRLGHTKCEEISCTFCGSEKHKRRNCPKKRKENNKQAPRKVSFDDRAREIQRSTTTRGPQVPRRTSDDDDCDNEVARLLRFIHE